MAATQPSLILTQKTPVMRVAKWFLIVCGLLLVTDNISHLILGTDLNYDHLISGALFLLFGFGIDYYLGKITINFDMVIRHRKKMGLLPEKHEQVHWKDIRRVTLYKSSIQLTDESDTTIKLRLPNYTSSNFRS